MTVDKLKKMLQKTPGTAKFLIVLIILLSILFACFIPSMGWYALVFLAIIGLMIYSVVKTVNNLKSIKERGQKSIDYLERNNIIESAASEYGGAQNYSFRLSEVNRLIPLFTSRKNILSNNFVFAMCSNAVITYNDIDEVYLVNYQWVKRTKHGRIHYKNDVLMIRTLDGEELPLYNIYMCRYTKKATETLNTILAIIGEKNPDCSISSDVTETRGQV